MRKTYLQLVTILLAILAFSCSNTSVNPLIVNQSSSSVSSSSSSVDSTDSSTQTEQITVDSLKVWLGEDSNLNKYSSIYGWYRDEINQHPWDPNCYKEKLEEFGWDDNKLRLSVDTLQAVDKLDEYVTLIISMDSLQATTSKDCSY